MINESFGRGSRSKTAEQLPANAGFSLSLENPEDAADVIYRTVKSDIPTIREYPSDMIPSTRGSFIQRKESVLEPVRQLVEVTRVFGNIGYLYLRVFLDENGTAELCLDARFCFEWGEERFDAKGHSMGKNTATAVTDLDFDFATGRWVERHGGKPARPSTDGAAVLRVFRKMSMLITSVPMRNFIKRFDPEGKLSYFSRMLVGLLNRSLGKTSRKLDESFARGSRGKKATDITAGVDLNPLDTTSLETLEGSLSAFAKDLGFDDYEFSRVIEDWQLCGISWYLPLVPRYLKILPMNKKELLVTIGMQYYIGNRVVTIMSSPLGILKDGDVWEPITDCISHIHTKLDIIVQVYSVNKAGKLRTVSKRYINIPIPYLTKTTDFHGNVKVRLGDEELTSMLSRLLLSFAEDSVLAKETQRLMSDRKIANKYLGDMIKALVSENVILRTDTELTESFARGSRRKDASDISVETAFGAVDTTSLRSFSESLSDLAEELDFGEYSYRHIIDLDGYSNRLANYSPLSPRHFCITGYDKHGVSVKVGVQYHIGDSVVDIHSIPFIISRDFGGDWALLTGNSIWALLTGNSMTSDSPKLPMAVQVYSVNKFNGRMRSVLRRNVYIDVPYSGIGTTKYKYVARLSDTELSSMMASLLLSFTELSALSMTVRGLMSSTKVTDPFLGGRIEDVMKKNIVLRTDVIDESFGRGARIKDVADTVSGTEVRFDGFESVREYVRFITNLAKERGFEREGGAYGSDSLTPSQPLSFRCGLPVEEEPDSPFDSSADFRFTRVIGNDSRKLVLRFFQEFYKPRDKEPSWSNELCINADWIVLGEGGSVSFGESEFETPIFLDNRFVKKDGPSVRGVGYDAFTRMLVFIMDAFSDEGFCQSVFDSLMGLGTVSREELGDVVRTYFERDAGLLAMKSLPVTESFGRGSRGKTTEELPNNKGFESVVSLAEWRDWLHDKMEAEGNTDPTVAPVVRVGEITKTDSVLGGPNNRVKLEIGIWRHFVFDDKTVGVSMWFRIIAKDSAAVEWETLDSDWMYGKYIVGDDFKGDAIKFFDFYTNEELKNPKTTTMFIERIVSLMGDSRLYDACAMFVEKANKLSKGKDDRRTVEKLLDKTVCASFVDLYNERGALSESFGRGARSKKGTDATDTVSLAPDFTKMKTDSEITAGTITYLDALCGLGGLNVTDVLTIQGSSAAEFVEIRLGSPYRRCVVLKAFVDKKMMGITSGKVTCADMSLSFTNERGFDIIVRVFFYVPNISGELSLDHLNFSFSHSKGEWYKGGYIHNGGKNSIDSLPSALRSLRFLFDPIRERNYDGLVSALGNDDHLERRIDVERYFLRKLNDGLNL